MLDTNDRNIVYFSIRGGFGKTPKSISFSTKPQKRRFQYKENTGEIGLGVKNK